MIIRCGLIAFLFEWRAWGRTAHGPRPPVEEQDVALALRLEHAICPRVISASEGHYAITEFA